VRRKEVTVNKNQSDRSSGSAKEMGGTIKKNIGKAIGNERMEAEGEAKELRGQAQQETAKTKERGKGAVEETMGAVKNRVGEVIDDDEMAAEGKAKELTGKARQTGNR
jgi:uncharacterized protein YjbJ (UPF0337 family)